MADLFLFPEMGDTEIDDLPPDHESRKQALDVERSLIVEAPAGSGKTGLLIQRYLKLLAHQSVDEPEQVMAITFTVKATTEIRERILEQLENSAKGAPLKSDSSFERETRALALAVLERDRTHSWNLVEHPRRFRVQTIDSICAEIARSLPVLSGGGGQSPVEDATTLYREAAQQTLMQLGGEDAILNASLHTVLLHRDGNLAECESLIADMLQWRDQWGELVPLGHNLTDAYLDNTVLPKLQRALEEAICAGLTRLSQSVPPDILEELALLAGEMGHGEGYKGEPSPIALCAGLRRAPGETSDHLEHWRALIHLLVTKDAKWRSGVRSNWLGFALEKEHASRLKELIQHLRERDDILDAIKRVSHLPPSTYPHEQWIVAKALFHILNRAMAELQLVFAQRGECDFTQLGLLARSALRRDGAVDGLNEAFGMKLQHLLVDEMQDTSTGQYELLQLLTQGWDGQSQTVFLVGDPKQSIYLFRQARVERFLQTMENEQLGDLLLQALRLTANFRSQKDLVESFNEDFALLFPRTTSRANPEEVTYVRAEAVNGPAQNGGLGLVWHTQVLPSRTLGDEAKREKRRQSKYEAQQIREIVQQWRARPLPQNRQAPWKIAVLVRTRNHLAHVVSAFKEDHDQGAIPFRAVDIEPLTERQEVLDLSALTRALLHPADRVAWLAVLRAPWCALELAELQILTGADDPHWAGRSIQDILEERSHLLSEASRAKLTRVWPMLQAAIQHRGKLTTAQLVERTWRSLGGEATVKEDEMANAHRYLQLLDEVEQEAGTLDLNLLQRRIDKLYAKSTASEGAVDLMTIHGAKGLEWDVVIVPGLERKARVTRERLLNWNEILSIDAKSAHIMLAPIASKGEASRELNAWLRGIDRARDAAERKRLFYVACTRAREELHLFASPQTNKNGEVTPASGTLLETAWPAAENYFTNVTSPSRPNVIEIEPIFTPEVNLAIAASTDDTPHKKTQTSKLHRLPLEFDPTARFKTSTPLFKVEPDDSHEMYFARPEGSFEARSLGNAVHAFLEVIAKRIAAGIEADKLLQEIAAWQTRIAAVLRGDGLPTHIVERLAARVTTALSNTLRDPEGLWLLSSHAGATSEYALTAWEETRNSVRLDRVFRAGSEPMAKGDDHLWIIDYKTATHGREGIKDFLDDERTKYAPQMNAYAHVMRSVAEPEKIRVGLFYPMLPKLIWWVPESD